jgi:uncharacterized membrane protein
MDFLSVDVLALVLFLICLLLSIYFRERARRLNIATGKKIRSEYRHHWVEAIVKRNEQRILTEVLRNNVMVSTALLSSLIISFGFIINAGSGALLHDSDPIAHARIVLIIGLLAYSFFMILLELRTLIYIPIIFGTSEKLIVKYESMKKVEYVAKLLHQSFDHFSNAIRALFFIVALLIWFYNTYAFVAFTLLLTYVMVREDFGGKSEITIF